MESNLRSENILLIGYRGTGKSTLGKRLADVLGMAFIDMDGMIVDEQGCSISRIIQERGWPYFRQLEGNLLQRLSEEKGRVIATGGGIILDPENRALLNKMGWVVWLKADTDVMVERLKSDREGAEQRPAFSDRDLREETEIILQARTHLYESVSDVFLDTTALSPGESVDEIVRIIHKREKSGAETEK
jgi:shikimate kinase